MPPNVGQKPKARLTDTEIAHIVFNETRSLKDPAGAAEPAAGPTLGPVLDTSVAGTTPSTGFEWGQADFSNLITPTWSMLDYHKASISPGGINQARINIAHAIMNADATLPTLPEMASKRAKAPAVEQSVYADCVRAVSQARSEFNATTDPTSGATNFNFRKDSRQGTFYKLKIKTSIGPLDNSYPTKDLPSKGIYANTYG